MPTLFLCFWGLLLSLCPYFFHTTSANHVHIVYLGLNQISDPLLTTKSHLQLLSNVFSSKEEAKEAMLYSYKHSFSGFSAKLNSTQAATLAKMKGVISVFKSQEMRLHTTRSWDFLGLSLDYNNKETATALAFQRNKVSPLQLAYGHDVVLGIFDTGIWPESESFQEVCGMRPIPSSWKGTCEEGEDFDPLIVCNRKLIGARYYLKGFEQKYGLISNTKNKRKEYRSARDFLGHGTHTASTAAGNIVMNASFFNLARGIARGGAPMSRLAVYKVCWSEDFEGKCMEEDVLAAFDDALRDGVNVISASFGDSPPLLPFFYSAADIGSFHAAQLGVNVVFSAGNDGPDASLVANVAPWSLSVAASTIDRTFPTQLLIDNNISITGQSFNIKQIIARLIYGRRYFYNGICKAENWRNRKVSGNLIILCFSTIGPVTIGDATLAALAANASGLIFAEPSSKQSLDLDIIPTIHIDIDQGTKILDYLVQSSKNTTEVKVTPSRTTIGQSPAPTISYFSSRGPNSRVPDILKPDITAPGINILAAWPPQTPPTLLPNFDHRSVVWNFQSGTSMSCPHVSGVVAILKSLYPSWSSAAIQSSLLTTAYTTDTTKDDIIDGKSMKLVDPFDIGFGHINPLKAMDPGLVYDMSTRDYILFLCNIGYNKAQIEQMVLVPSKVNTKCPKRNDNTNANINLPSITVSNLKSRMTIRRTLRNVNGRISIYFVSITEPKGVHVEVWPRILIFFYHCREISYYVTLTPLKHSEGRYDFGKIIWSDSIHHVTSPLIVRVNNTIDINTHISSIDN